MKNVTFLFFCFVSVAWARLKGLRRDEFVLPSRERDYMDSRYSNHDLARDYAATKQNSKLVQRLDVMQTKIPGETKVPKGVKAVKATKAPKGAKESKVTKGPKGTMRPKATKIPKATQVPKGDKVTNTDTAILAVSPSPSHAPDTVSGNNDTAGTSSNLDSQSNQRTLAVSAFLYETLSVIEPTKDDIAELTRVTQQTFDDLYASYYGDDPSVAFGYTDISSSTLLSPRLVKFRTTLYFKDGQTTPTLMSAEIAASQELRNGTDLYQQHLQRLNRMQSEVFSSTTSFQYIADAKELQAIQDASNDSESPRHDYFIAIIVASAVLLSLCICCFMYFRSRRQRRELTVEELEAMERKVARGEDENVSVTESPTVLSECRTSAFGAENEVVPKVAASEGRHKDRALEMELEDVITKMNCLEDVSLEDGDPVRYFAEINKNEDKDSNSLVDDTAASNEQETEEDKRHSVHMKTYTTDWKEKEVGEGTSYVIPVIKDTMVNVEKTQRDPSNAEDLVETNTVALSEKSLLEDSVKTKADPLVSLETIKAASAAEAKPAWITKRLKPVGHAVSEKNNTLSGTNNSSDESASIPEWMKKFREMGLEKPEQ